MKRKRFSVEQIVAVLKEHELGIAGTELCRRIGVSENTFYRWKRVYGGLQPSEARRLKQLEDENAKLKRLVAELTLDKAMLQDRRPKKMVRPAARREVARYLQQRYEVSERRACRTIAFSRATLRYQSHLDPRTALGIRMRDIAHTRIRYGYRRVRVMLRREGWTLSKNLVYRLYREEGLPLRTGLKRRRRAPVQRQARAVPTAPNHAWTLDFVSDQLVDGARFRALTVLDVHTRQCLAIEIGSHLRGAQVVAVLDELRHQHGAPKALFCDNGSEFASRIVDFWAYQHEVRIDFSRPGKPTDNGHIEAFNGSFRRECLNAHWFTDLDEARKRIEAWRREYNEIRPHRASMI